ncbi:hypothetical protein WJX74_002415 [Apatococcus lobatus]|uniref:RNA methyltransferase n=1 Tax=Apatococcus lobatus TaxID=904363 RepID=A0AAW1SB53_9CHLO
MGGQQSQDHLAACRRSSAGQKHNATLQLGLWGVHMVKRGGLATPDKNKRKKLQKTVEETSPAAAQQSTLSICVPGSVVDNCQTREQATIVAGQIARTAAIFNVDEVVVIDDSGARAGEVGAGAAFLARILQYMETPQYLRKTLVAMHQDLRMAGSLPPLDAPHHLRASEWGPYREGIVKSSDPAWGSTFDIGLEQDAFVEEALRPGLRVTLAMGESAEHMTISKGPFAGQVVLRGCLAHPLDPKQQRGMYWGYQTRLAPNLAAALSDCPFQASYDLKIGTSERGKVSPAKSLKLPSAKHVLVAFGGPLGLEHCQKVAGEGDGNDVSHQFDMYLNTCQKQGSRTIRTEEAILISLTYLQDALQASIT